MFELFSMSLRDYWTEENDEIDNAEVDNYIEELQDVLSEHYGKDVHWKEEASDTSRGDEEIPVDVIDDCQLSSLHAVAAKLELDGNMDGFELNPNEPWDCDIFERLADVDDEASEDSVEKFCHLLSIGNSMECFCLPVDLPFVAQINIGDDDDDEDDEAAEHECHCDDDEETCDCELDDGSVDISSLQALRRELDLMADGINLDKSLDIDDDDAMNFGEDDSLRNAKIAWYLLSKRVNESLAAGQPLIIRYADDEEYEDIDEE